MIALNKGETVDKFAQTLTDYYKYIEYNDKTLLLEASKLWEQLITINLDM